MAKRGGGKQVLECVAPLLLPQNSLDCHSFVRALIYLTRIIHPALLALCVSTPPPQFVRQLGNGSVMLPRWGTRTSRFL